LAPAGNEPVDEASVDEASVDEVPVGGVAVDGEPAGVDAVAAGTPPPFEPAEAGLSSVVD
jgi:hypothetical protein